MSVEARLNRLEAEVEGRQHAAALTEEARVAGLLVLFRQAEEQPENADVQHRAEAVKVLLARAAARRALS